MKICEACLDFCIYVSKSSSGEKLTFWKLPLFDDTVIDDKDESFDILPLHNVMSNPALSPIKIQCAVCRKHDAEYEIMLDWKWINDELDECKSHLRLLVNARQEQKKGLHLVPTNRIQLTRNGVKRNMAGKKPHGRFMDTTGFDINKVESELHKGKKR